MQITSFLFCKVHVCYYKERCATLSNNLSNITVSGTKSERGLLAWDKTHLEDSSSTLGTEEVYNLPFGITSCLSSQSWVRYIPFCPQKGHRSQYRSEDNMSQGRWGEQLPEGTVVIDELAL